jgi:hypothetical protein
MRFLFVLLVIAVAACLIFILPNLPGHNALVAEWDSLKTTIGPNPFRFVGLTSNAGETRSLAARVLRPLEGAPTPPNEQEDIGKTIADIHAKAGSGTSAANINAALNLIQQAFEERKNILKTLASATHTGTLDTIPDNWRFVRQPDKTFDHQVVNQQNRELFWTQATGRRWQERCAAYQQRIEQLLGGQ